VDFKKNKTEKMYVYKGVGGCKGVLKSGIYIYNKMRVRLGVYPPRKPLILTRKPKKIYTID